MTCFPNRDKEIIDNEEDDEDNDYEDDNDDGDDNLSWTVQNYYSFFLN